MPNFVSVVDNLVKILHKNQRLNIIIHHNSSKKFDKIEKLMKTDNKFHEKYSQILTKKCEKDLGRLYDWRWLLIKI